MIRYAGKSIIGRKDNGINDDCLLLNGQIQDEYEEGASAHLLAAVFDGVGGSAHGDMAARMAAEALAQLSGESDKEEILDAVRIANQRILLKQQSDSAYAQMATTVAGIAIYGNDYIVFNLGDSRVYHLGSYFSQLTRDHSYQRMLEDTLGSGTMMEQQFEHVIMRCLGDIDGDHPDILEGKNKIRPGDWFLLCSDGLHDYLDIEALEDRLRGTDVVLSELCNQLVKEALDNGSHDNISVLLCRVEGE